MNEIERLAIYLTVVLIGLPGFVIATHQIARIILSIHNIHELRKAERAEQ